MKMYDNARFEREVSFRVPVLGAAFKKNGKVRHRKVRITAHLGAFHTHRVRLEFFHPQAREVNIAGSFNDWRPGWTWMIALGDGRWVKELMLPPGRYEYCFVADGHWLEDLKAAESVVDSRGCRHSVLVVPQSNGHAPFQPLITLPVQRIAAQRRASVSESERNGP